MSQAPSMPMFWDAYIADTTHLTTEEHGAYLLLLGAMWRRNGWVPDDDNDNARILGLTIAKWRKIKARLSIFLMFENGQISQKNLLKIWKNTQEKIKKNRENGSKGGRPKSSENNNLAKANGFVSDNPNETIPEPEPEPEPEPYKEVETSNDVSSPEPEKSAPVCMSMPVTTGPDVQILESEADDWSVAFPAVDVRQQLAAMRAWVIANPTKRKTRRGVRRFIVSWLDREQNRGGQRQPRQHQPPQTFKDGFTEALDREIERGRHERNHSSTGHLDASQPGTAGTGAEIVELASSAFRRW